jgi:hypothetical protein
VGNSPSSFEQNLNLYLQLVSCSSFPTFFIARAIHCPRGERERPPVESYSATGVPTL